MTKFNELLSNFRSGELSPKFWGRKDLRELGQGAALLENFKPLNTGGVTKRGGTEYLNDLTQMAWSGSRGPALIPFVISKEESYIVAINPNGAIPTGASDRYIRVYTTSGVEVTYVTNEVYIQAPPADLNPKEFVFTQIGDIMWITHTSGRFRPMTVQRFSEGNIHITDFEWVRPRIALSALSPAVDQLLKFPYRDPNVSGITITPSATSGTITLTASSALFDSGMVDTYIKITHGATTGVAKITAFSSNVSVTASVVVNFGATTASDNWEESAWSDFRGWPRSVAAFEQRLCFGGNISEPDTIWNSQTGNVFNMMQRRLIQDFGSNASGLFYFIPAIPDDQKVYNGLGIQILENDPFSFAISANEVNSITWMSSGRDLAVGTLGGEYIIDGGNSGYSQLSVRSRRQTEHGSSPRAVIRLNNEVLYITRDGKKIRSFKYNDANGSYISADVSIFGEHMVRVGKEFNFSLGFTEEFIGLAHQKSLDTMLVINNRAKLLGYTYSLENQNLGWYRYTFPTNGEEANVFGVCSVPNEQGNNDDIYVVVERLDSSNTSTFCLERLTTDFEGETMLGGFIVGSTPGVTIRERFPQFLDSAFIRNNANQDQLQTISGLDRFEGLDVTVMYRGEIKGTFTVASGQIDLGTSLLAEINSEEGILACGVKFTANLETVDLEAGLNAGTSEGQIQRIDRVVTRFYNSKEVKIGSLVRQDPVNFRLSSSVALSNEQVRTDIPNSPDYENKVKIVSDEPFPCTILSMAVRGNTYD